MQVVLAVASMAVILLHEHLVLVWAVSCVALVLVTFWPTIMAFTRKAGRKSGPGASPRVSGPSRASDTLTAGPSHRDDSVAIRLGADSNRQDMV